MLAPPASLATSRRGSAPSPLSRSISSGTAVSGNFARLVMSRARLMDGSSTWAIAPAFVCASCSMIATHDPSPSVTSTPSPRSAAQSATLTMTSFTRGEASYKSDGAAAGRLAEGVEHEHRDRVGFFSRRAARRPDAEIGLRGAEPAEMGPEGVPRFEVAEELGDVDRERVEQLLILARVAIEQPAV